jgi:hypothetical protein
MEEAKRLTKEKGTDVQPADVERWCTDPELQVGSFLEEIYIRDAHRCVLGRIHLIVPNMRCVVGTVHLIVQGIALFFSDAQALAEEVSGDGEQVRERWGRWVNVVIDRGSE